MIPYRQYIVLFLLMLLYGIGKSQDGNQPVLDLVTVDTSINNHGQVTVFWTASPSSPDLTFEIQCLTHTLYITDLPSTLRQWSDALAKADQRVEAYQITSKIPGQDQTIWSEKHQTIILQILADEYDTCNQAIPLQWTYYVGSATNKYQLFVKKDNKPYVALNPAQGDTNFLHSQLEPNSRYKYYIEATLANGKKSLSNYAEFTTYQPLPVNAEELIIDTIVNNDGTVAFHCQVDAEADLHGYRWQKISGSIIENIKFETEYSSGNVTLTNESFGKNNGYRVAAIDLCNNESAYSNTVYPIELTANQNGNMVDVDWNQSFETIDNEIYQLVVEIDNLGTKILTFNNTSQSLSLDELGDENSQQFCFRVIATSGQKISTSNRVCIIRKPNIEIPTGFTPNSDGQNDTFGPIIHNANIRSYQMIVFDQFGGRVFESNNREQRWDGMCKGLPVIEGGYVYYLKITTDYNQTFEIKGAVNVIFP